MSLLTRNDLRDELQYFASDILAKSLSDLHCRLVADLRAEDVARKDWIAEPLQEVTRKSSRMLSASKDKIGGILKVALPFKSAQPAADEASSPEPEADKAIALRGKNLCLRKGFARFVPDDQQPQIRAPKDIVSNASLPDANSYAPMTPQSPPTRVPSSRLLTEVFEDENEEEETFLSKLANFNDVGSGMLPCVDRPAFTCVSSIVAFLNAALIGAQTDYAVHLRGDEHTLFFLTCDAVFCMFFAIEVLCRLGAYGYAKFFKMRGWQWNVFDCVVVVLQLVDVIVHGCLDFSGNQQRPDMVEFVMRLMRLLRTMRILRVLRLVQELQEIAASIMGSMKSLFWTLAFMLLLIFCCSVCITQAVGEHLLEASVDASTSDHAFDELKYYYGSLMRSVLTLYESITSGLSWDSAVNPLFRDVSAYAALLFCAYITFSVFAMMNAVTGVFCEKALKNVAAEEEEFLASTCRKTFEKRIFKNKSDCSDRMISWEEFESQLHSKEVQEYFRAIDICISEAEGLFTLLDKDNSGRIDFEHFMRGLLKLRGSAKSLDLTLLMTETDEMYKRLGDHMEVVEWRLNALCGMLPQQPSESIDRS